jgi:aryl-alcohol dehydrogenase-like predicted oxidoreductase
MWRELRPSSATIKLMPFLPRPLGHTGLTVGAIGLGSSYGAPAESIPYAFDLGVRYFYWGSRRTGSFAEGIRGLSAKRSQIAVVVQTYSRIAALIPGSVERALRRLNTDYADVLLLGLWNRPVPPRILDACLELHQRGLIRHIALSTHHRPLIPRIAAEAPYEIFHIRYNAKHRGAEQEIFPHLPGAHPGIVSFTATSWRQLLNPKRMPHGEPTPTAADCYRFVLSNPSVDVCMAAPSNLDQAEAIADALKRGPMDQSELAWMRRIGDHLYGRVPAS